MTDSTPQGREKGAGERARELAEKLIVWDYSETSPTAHPKPRIDLDVLIEALATSYAQGVADERKAWQENERLDTLPGEPSGELD